MPLFSPYFPLESNAYRVGKSGQLRRQMGTAGFGLYVMVLSHLRDCPDCTAELDYDALGYELHEDPALVRRVVEDFGLFLLDREHGTFTAEALREVAAAARPRARSKRNNAERHRRERKSSRRTTDNDDALPEETTEEADNDDTRSGEKAAAADDTADLFPDETEEEADNADTRSDATAQDDAPTADAAAADESAPSKNVRSLAERKEENKKPSPPIVPLPQGVSGKGETPQNALREEEAQSRFSAVAVSLPPPSARGDESKLSAVSEKAETNAERPTPSNEMPATAQPTTATTADNLPKMRAPSSTASETTPQVVENSTKGEGYAPESEGKVPLVNAPANTAGETTPQGMENLTEGEGYAPESEGNLPLVGYPSTTASETTPQGMENSTKGERYAPESEENFPLVSDPSNTASETTPQEGENSLDVKEDDERTERNRRPAHWTRERFVAPNAKEVAAYAHFLGRPRFNALQFVLYYESRGWLLQGGLAVADWRSLVKLWLVRGDVQRRGAQGEPQTAYAAQTGGFSGRNAPKSPISSTDGGKTSPSFPSAAGVRQPTRTTSVQQRREDDLARWASTLLGVTPDALSAGSTSFATPSSPDLAASFATSADTSPQLLLGADESGRSFAYADEYTTDYQAFADENTAPDNALSAHVAEPARNNAQKGAKGEAEVRLTGETSDRQPTENNPLDTEALPETGGVSAHENTLLFTFNTPPHVSRKSLEPFPVAHGGKRAPRPDGRGHVHPLPLADESSPTDDAAERRRSAAERRECTACLHEYRAGCVPF